MSADEKPRWRQLSWVTYGNAYLNGYAPFSSWHGIESFEDTAAEFRLIDGTLIAGDGRLDSATHPKNESSIYYWPPPEVQKQLDDLSRTIEQQLERVLCLAGSETGWRLSEHPVPSPGDVSGGGSGAAVNLGASGNTMSVGVGALLALTVTLTLLMIAAWHFPKTASVLGLILILHRSFKR